MSIRIHLRGTITVLKGSIVPAVASMTTDGAVGMRDGDGVLGVRELAVVEMRDDGVLTEDGVNG